MNTHQPNMLDFVKAMSDAERLKIIGALVRRPKTAAQVAEKLGMDPRTAFQHLSFLAFVGAVRKDGELYALDETRLASLARETLEKNREEYIPAPELDETARKVLASFLSADGSIRQIPIQQPAKLRVILEYLVAAFTPGQVYTEKEVNSILRRFHLDTAGLRRDLIDAGLLQRESDGSAYWRPQ